MLNRYPLWKYLLILAVIAIGVMFSLPNLYAPDPAIQIAGSNARISVNQSVLKKATDILDKSNIEYFGAEVSDNNLLIRLKDKDLQSSARDNITLALGDDYVVALNLADNTPEWLKGMGAQPMKLGLDLSGGVHFLLEVDTSVVVDGRMEAIKSEFQGFLSENKIRYKRLTVNDTGQLIAIFRNKESADRGANVLRGEFPLMLTNVEEKADEVIISIELSEPQLLDLETRAIDQNLVALRNRVNSSGVSEALVQRQGRNRIVIELPGVQDPAATKRLIGKTANLEFRLEANSNSGATERFKFRESEVSGSRGQAVLERKIIVTGDSVAGASSGLGEGANNFQVNITLNGDAGKKMFRTSSPNVGRNMGVLFIEYNTKTVDAEGNKLDPPIQVVNKEIISLATIQGPLGSQFNINGLDSPAEAAELALLLEAGALAAPMHFVQENTIGPSLGEANISKGLLSIQFGFGLVLLFMIVFYKLFGIAANIALAVNLVLLAACMSMLGATLTLPGIAGIVLTVGMAVDANVLIFSRIKEELASGLSPQASINNGFGRAFTTILDANITTLIVAVILFAIGSGPVKGFAVTLSIGILTSMFTAIVVTRAVVNLMYGGRAVKKLLI